MWRFKVLLSVVLLMCAWAQFSDAAQHDYVIDNAPGATVRADINSSLQAIVTNNSGATEPATTYPNMWWYDTSTSLLKRRNNADDAWITVGLEAASTDGTFSANSDSLVPTQKAAKTYADTKISKSTAAEIYNVSEKTTPASNDVLLLEDSASGYAKKSVKISNIRQSIDAVLPSQTGNSGKFLTTNGTNASWGAITSPAFTLVSSTTVTNATSATITGVSPHTTRYKILYEFHAHNPTRDMSGGNFVITNGSASFSSTTVSLLSGHPYDRGCGGEITTFPSNYTYDFAGRAYQVAGTVSGIVSNANVNYKDAIIVKLFTGGGNTAPDRFSFSFVGDGPVSGTIKVYELD